MPARRSWLEGMYSALPVALPSGRPAMISGAAAPLPLPLMAVVVARLLAEERFLRASLEGYEAYCQEVRQRLVPHVW